MTLFIGGIRFILRDFLHVFNKNHFYKTEINTVIYGAGSAGFSYTMLLKTLEIEINLFIDDNIDLWGGLLMEFLLDHLNPWKN